MSRTSSRASLLVRSLRHRVGAGVVVALVALLGAGVVTLWPRGVAAMEAEVVGARVGTSTDLARDLTVRTSSWAFDEDEAPGLEGTMQRVLGPAQAYLLALRDAIPEPARRLVGEPQVRLSDATDPLAQVADGPGSDVRFPELVRSAAPGFLERVRLVEGRVPTDAVPRPGEPAETLVSADGAARLGWDVGEVRGATLSDGGYTLVGTYEVVDPSDGYWLHTPAGAGPAVLEDLDRGVTVRVLGIVDPEVLAMTAARPVLDAWFPVSGAGVADPTTVAAQLRAAAASASADLGGVRFSTGMPDLLDSAVADVATSRTLASFALAGPLAALALALGVGTQGLVARRREDGALARARGASGLQVRGLAALQTWCVALPAAALGAGGAAALGSGVGPGAPGDLLGAAVVGTAPGLLAAALVAPPRASVARTRIVRALRVAGAVVLVVAAAVVTVLALAGRLPSDDPLVVALPALVAAATAVLVVALVRPLLGLLVAAARRRPGPGALVGLARAARGRPGVVAGILALVVGTGVVVQATALLTTVRAGAADGAWEATGADLRLSGPRMTPELVARVEAVDGVRLAVAAEVVTPADMRRGASGANVELLAVDTARLARLDAEGYRHALPDGLTATDGPVPVVVSTSVRADTGGALPDGTTLQVDGLRLPVVEVASRDVVAGLGRGSRWILADTGVLAAHGLTRSAPAVLLVDVEDSLDAAAVTALGDRLAEIVGTGDVRSFAPVRDARLADPTVAWLVRGVLVGAAVAVLGVLAALVAALAAAAPARRRTLATLRSVGASTRDVRAAVAAELTGWVVPGVVVGAALGLGLTLVAVGVVDLPTFLGAREVPPRVDLRALAVVVGAVAAAVAAATFLTARGGDHRARDAALLAEGEG
ncbi:hypothetical protein IGS67_02745 [Flavimobilis sp. GY10621]|uniref:ABC3 transporter permease C-terminal domain-containing protein n=1 Tax=Flavimobilis rhizosphaerae TaxID=2775421 RepID=A0ABR9DN53_9MICO|nr:FtsX-like permease family protein [Flavimobilis rhizosphaerae]MBD9698413.1 hypothetical protein [Flavimobilis rhizosphaerae]